MDFEIASNRVYKEKGANLIAEITFPSVKESLVDINHTFVDTSLRGQGIADKLMRAALTVVEETGCKARATCPYAIKWFAEHPEMSHLYE